MRAFADSIGDFDGLANALTSWPTSGSRSVLLPSYPLGLRDDGYDIADNRTIHPDYGDLRSFRRFFAAAHAHNLRVITELVANHNSEQHPWFHRTRRAPAGLSARDFYGEPGRPIGARSIKRSPLTDVAGIIRSLDYAGRVTLSTSIERGRLGEGQEAPFEQWRVAWTRRMTDVYRGTYLARLLSDPVGAALLPADAQDVALLLDAQVLLKALYEVRWELSIRPAWVGWPLDAVTQLIAGE